MPLSEFHQTTMKGKVETSQPKMTNCLSDLSLVMPDQDFVELLWENGQIVMQGHSNKQKKSPFAPFSSHTSKFQYSDSRDAVIPKIGNFGSTHSMVSDFAPSVPSAPIGLNTHDDDMAPWMNYPIDDSLQNDYCSEFLSEFTGVHLNSHSTNSNTVPADRSSGFDQTVRDSRNVEQGHVSKALAGGPEARYRTSQLFQLPQQCLISVPNTKSRAAEFGIAGSSSTDKSSCENFLDRSSQKHEVGASKPPTPPSSDIGVMNFSHFLGPVARVRSNIQSADRMRSHEKASSSNPMESTVISSPSGFKSLSVAQGQSASIPSELELRSSTKPPPEMVSVGESRAIPIHREETPKDKYTNNVTNVDTRAPDTANCQSSSVMVSVALVRHEVEKGPEAAVASSSVCSANSVGEETNDPKRIMKRKHREEEESGYQSDDVEDESVGLKKPSNARTMNAKRSRAAEVHNLSERRRRDRINEKMRALQELIPNCNKVDKASMLDEAIEYLKTLQLQVQIMSMGSGLCMPQMMIPPGMQHLRPPSMAHFSPMGLSMGMGMGLGYGMGTLDMNGSPGCSMIPVPPMHGQQFPCSSMPVTRPVANGLHGMPGSSSLQMYGIPEQGLPLSMPFGSMSGLPAKVNLAPQLSGAATTPLPAADTAPPSSSKDQEQKNM